MEIKWKTLTASECSAISLQWNDDFHKAINPLSDFKDSDLNDQYKEIRKHIVDLFEKTYSDHKVFSKHEYEIDLDLSIKIYDYFCDLGMTPTDASKDGIWRYIQMKVVPDMIFRRWKLKDGSLRDDRFWKQSWRLYLKILWWYVHLSYNVNLDETRAILQNNTSNDISQLVERTGEGYRIEYSREIMRRYGLLPKEKHGKDTLSHILMMNNILCTKIDPELRGESVEEYVDGLFKSLDL